MEEITTAMMLGMALLHPGASMQLTLPLGGDVERKTVTYQCAGVDVPLTVDYVNAPPNFLALVPVAGEQLVFAGVLSASGARYVAGPFEWWTKGGEATFRDLRYEAAPVACTENIDTP